MLYSLFSNLVDSYTILNVFKYLTVRTGLAMFTSMMVVFFIGNPIIEYFSSKKFIIQSEMMVRVNILLKKLAPQLWEVS